MPSFNVLDRKQDIHRHYLLEASAGTGKTFSIENIVTRLLIEDHPSEPMTLPQILVVTFTRAATRDLKIRIRSNIEKALIHLQCGTANSACPDYLCAVMEQGEEVIQKAKRRLEQALCCFDQAQIFTIHGFCARMLREHALEGNVRVDAIQEEQTCSDDQILQVIRDYFRTELRPESYCDEQLHIISKKIGNDTEKLEKEILSILKTGWEIEENADFSCQFKRFQTAMQKIRGHTAAKIISDFVQQAQAYEKVCDRQHNVKPEFLEKVQRFARLCEKSAWDPADFEMLIADSLIIVEALDPTKRKASVKLPTTLHYPDLINLLRQELWSIVKESSSPDLIIARIAAGCQKMLKAYLSEEEKLRFDDFLKMLLKGLENPRFTESIRSTYKAAIIDEFQDTDPTQWQIFDKLFLQSGNQWGNLYLVGDPKQSIYAFRQADIYTYLSAANALGQDHISSLDTNYRSQPSLVNALNCLFDSQLSPGLIALPRLNSTLPYHAVNSSPHNKERVFSDKRGSVHFCLGQLPEKRVYSLEKLETHSFLPFITKEIERLHHVEHLRFNQFAILVVDRFQAQRTADYLQAHRIPFALQRTVSLSESPALPALREVMLAALHPKDNSALKTALGGRVIGWTHDEVRELSDPSLHEKVLSRFYKLRKEWLENGFAAFFYQLMHSCWKDASASTMEKLLSEESGLEFYHDLQQLGDFLIEQETLQSFSAEALLAFLDQLPLIDVGDEDLLKRRMDPCQDAVNILTMHSSKGLEFDIVFALGLASRKKSPEHLLPVFKGTATQPILRGVIDGNSIEYQQYCDEIDAEKIRQLYVTMTRAKYRLYLPVILAPDDKGPTIGSASPMELFLARFGQPPIDARKLYERIKGYDGKILCDWIDKNSSDIKISYHHSPEASVPETVSAKVSTPPLLVPPSRVHVPGQRQYMYAFTTLSKKKSNVLPDDTLLQIAPKDFHATQKTPHTLPGNSETGNVLHKILETISYETVQIAASPTELIPVVKPFLIGTQYADWEQPISTIVYHALHTTLKTADGSVRLCDLNQEVRYHEMEFLYPYTAEMAVEELEDGAGFLKGVIDLIFEHEGKYYLLDWKSNWLGPSRDAYHRKALDLAMTQNNYFLQSDIYVEALRRYLQIVDKRPFPDIFGGVFYLFLRGLAADQATDTGVYYFLP